MKIKGNILVMGGLLLWASICSPPQAWTEGDLTTVALLPKELVEVKIHSLTIDANSRQPVVFLTDPQEERALLIWIGPCEANAMQGEMGGEKPPRPLTHDLAERILHKLKTKVQRVIVTHSKDGIYYATMVLEKEGSVMEIDARPSDSIVMALKLKAPIFISKALFAEMSVPLKEPKGVEEQYGLTVQDLTPSLAQSFSFASTRGVLVSEVRGGSPAAKDGLQRGDILAEVGGEPIADAKSLRAAFIKSKPPVKAKIFRKGDFLSLTLHPK